MVVKKILKNIGVGRRVLWLGVMNIALLPQERHQVEKLQQMATISYENVEVKVEKMTTDGNYFT